MKKAGEDVVGFVVNDAVPYLQSDDFIDTSMKVGGVAVGAMMIIGGAISLSVPEPTMITKSAGVIAIVGGVYQVAASIRELTK